MKSSIITPTEHDIALIVHRHAIIDSRWFPRLVDAMSVLIGLGVLWAVYVNDSTVMAWLCLALMYGLFHLNTILHYRNMIRFMASCRNLEFPIDEKQLSDARYKRTFRLLIFGAPIALLVLIILFG